MATMSNTNEESFGTMGAAVTITHFVLKWGTAIAFSKTLTASRTYASGDEVVMEAGDLDVTLTNNEGGAAWTKDLLDEYITANGSPTVTLHTDDPGSSGSNNEVTTTGYSSQTIEMTTAQ